MHLLRELPGKWRCSFRNHLKGDGGKLTTAMCTLRRDREIARRGATRIGTAMRTRTDPTTRVLPRRGTRRSIVGASSRGVSLIGSLLRGQLFQVLLFRNPWSFTRRLRNIRNSRGRILGHSGRRTDLAACAMACSMKRWRSDDNRSIKSTAPAVRLARARANSSRWAGGIES